MSNAIIYEQGNGWPREGDYCGGEGQLWLVESIDSRIRTDTRGNYINATVTEADWDDCDEGDVHSARVCTTPARDWDPEIDDAPDSDRDSDDGPEAQS